MRPEDLPSINYYEAFRHGGWDFTLLREVTESMELPDDVIESLREPHEATLLVLGSATYNNIGHMACIDRALRPGQGHNDTVVMIDYNAQPMAEHQEEWDWLKPGVRDEGAYEELLYPDFQFRQADMRELPMDPETFDVAVSDYTLNFLDNFEDVLQTFSEVNRVLKPNGVMLLAVAGHENIDPTIPFDEVADIPAQAKQRMGGLVTYQFPVQAYTEAACQRGLQVRASRVNGTDIFCVVLQKLTS